MYCEYYLRRGLVYIPTIGVTKHDLYRVVDPVTVVPSANTDALRHGIAEAMSRGNPEVPALKPSDYPPPVLPKHAGVKSLSAFVRDASLWAIDEQNGRYRLLGYRRVSSKGWLHDKKLDVVFPADASIDQVIERMIMILQDAS